MRLCSGQYLSMVAIPSLIRSIYAPRQLLPLLLQMAQTFSQGLAMYPSSPCVELIPTACDRFPCSVSSYAKAARCIGGLDTFTSAVSLHPVCHLRLCLPQLWPIHALSADLSASSSLCAAVLLDDVLYAADWYWTPRAWLLRYA